MTTELCITSSRRRDFRPGYNPHPKTSSHRIWMDGLIVQAFIPVELTYFERAVSAI